MLSNQIIQASIEELRSITKTDLWVMDTAGNVAAATAKQEKLSAGQIAGFVRSEADSQVVGSSCLFKVMQEDEPVYVVLADGSEDAHMVGKIAVSQIRQLMTAYKEKLDKDSFLQNLLLDNLLLVDIYNRAKKLLIPIEGNRAVLLVEADCEDNSEIVELLRELFVPYNGDYLTAVEEKNLILIKSLQENEGYPELKETADMIVDMVNAEAMVNVKVSCGTIVSELRDVSKSFKEAKVALEVGKIFYAERNVTSYHALGIGRLIYQLPENLCRIFIQEIFGSEEIPDDIDEEILSTVQKFFENNLNISETARQLFVHRNTLVYRIEKVQKATGLDMRVFEDALTFNIALMVASYLKYLEAMDS